MIFLMLTIDAVDAKAVLDSGQEKPLGKNKSAIKKICLMFIDIALIFIRKICPKQAGAKQKDGGTDKKILESRC
ncbi:hypothetical protein EBS02_10510 [bacterium]|nr:hypothetical protein [bacterium]